MGWLGGWEASALGGPVRKCSASTLLRLSLLGSADSPLPLPTVSSHSPSQAVAPGS